MNKKNDYLSVHLELVASYMAYIHIVLYYSILQRCIKRHTIFVSEYNYMNNTKWSPESEMKLAF